MVAKASTSTSSALTSISTHELSLTSPSSSSAFSPNPLLPLLSLCRHPSPEVAHKAIYAVYRVFSHLAGEGRLFAAKVEGEKNEGKGSREEVAKWIRERLEEFLVLLCGLMRDSEPALRKSAISIYISLLPPISLALSNHLDSSPLLSLPHIRLLLRHLLFGTSSTRGGKLIASPSSSSKPTWQILPENQWKLSPVSDAEDPQADSRIPEEVKSELVQKLVDNDDLRWAFFKELSSLLEYLNNPSSALSARYDLPPAPECLSSNVLALLLPLQNLPKESEDINTFWCPHVSGKPSKKVKSTAEGAGKNKKLKSKAKKDAKPTEGQDWMAFYDSSSEESGSDDDDSTTTTGSKRRRSGFIKKSQHALIHSPHSHQSLFTRSWLGLISLGPSPIDTRSVLLLLHASILPNMVRGKVVRLTDWLGGLVDDGGALALLALNGLYILIRDYNLEYTGFYRRLYGLVDREVMHVKYRARFFRLSDTFLSSPLLPAALVASFIKRLAQLALTSPPAAIIMIIPFIYNLLKKHPACMMMLQGPDSESDSKEESKYLDPYDPKESDPARTGALDSSLWELRSLQRHYLSHVATMAKLFGEVFTKPEFVLEDFLDHGYSSLFDTEMGRKIRSDPALNVDEAGTIFPAKRATTEGEEDYRPGERDLVAELWTFGPAI